MLIPLVCNQCGGKLEVEKSQVFESGDSVIVLNDQTFNCPHCGTKYLPGEKISHAPVKAVISIGGHVTGNIIVGNGMVVNNNPNPTSPQQKRIRWILAGLIFLVIVLCAVILAFQQ